jgi:hypothetical protein
MARDFILARFYRKNAKYHQKNIISIRCFLKTLMVIHSTSPKQLILFFTQFFSRKINSSIKLFDTLFHIDLITDEIIIELEIES